MWLAALALHKTNEELKALEQHVSLDNFTLRNTDMLSVNISSRIYNNALNTSFYGATVSFFNFSPYLIGIFMENLYAGKVMCNNYNNSSIQGSLNLLSNGDRAPELRFYQYRPQGNSKCIHQGYID